MYNKISTFRTLIATLNVIDKHLLNHSKFPTLVSSKNQRPTQTDSKSQGPNSILDTSDYVTNRLCGGDLIYLSEPITCGFLIVDIL